MIIITVFPWQFLVINQNNCYNTENCVVFLQKTQKQPLEVFCKKRDSNTGVFLWNWRNFWWTDSFTKHLQWLLLWFLQENNAIFIVITIILGYNQKLSWKYCNYYHPFLYKNIHLLSKARPLVQKFCTVSRQSPNFMTQSSIYNFNIFKGNGVSHSNTVHLIASLSKVGCPIYPEDELTSL